MSKDPAFLFYSKDFYEGTRTMLPEERACYIDLLIYQHQHGEIPNDLKRVLMYCSGVDEATLKATLEAKFKATDKGWVNVRLMNESENRANFKSSLSDNGMVGQFFKKAKAELSPVKYKALRDYVYNELGKDELIKLIKIPKTTHEATLEGLLKHLVNEDVNVNKDIKGVETQKIKYPSLVEFLEYAKTLKPYSKNLEFAIEAKYNAWNEAGWVDGFGNKIKNWKTKLQNTITKLSPTKETETAPIRPHKDLSSYGTN